MQTVLTYFFTLLAPLAGGGNSWLCSKQENGQFFSKNYTTVLKGLCSLIVIYVHVREPYVNLLQDAIGSFAYVCVTIFFVISAYGMMLSEDKKKDYLKNFWRNRLAALLIPAFLINILSFCLNVFNSGNYRLSVLYYLNGYVAVLLQWCLLFYIIMWCKSKWFPSKKFIADFLLIAGVTLSSLLLYLFVDAEVSADAGWCFERMGLVWGLLLYRYFNWFVNWMDKQRLVKVIVFVILGGILGVLYLKYKTVFFWGAYLLKIVLGIVLIILLFTMTSNRQFGDKRSLWLGNISYEVYLSHGIVMGALAIWLPIDVNSGLFILLTVILTLAISAVIHSISKPLVDFLRY